MKEELKKSLRTYGALLLLGVTGVPLGAVVGLIEGKTDADRCNSTD